MAPTSGPEDAPTRLTITGEGLVPHVRTDFSSRGESSVDATFQARLGTVELLDVRLLEPGMLEATVPVGLVPGTYTLTVVDPLGREGALPEAFVVQPALEGTRAVVGFRFEPVGPQRSSEHFQATVHAVDGAGKRVAGFNGMARLSDETGTVVPALLGPFRDGTWSGRVEVRGAATANVLTVTDAENHTGRSNVFSVSTRDAVALRFDSPPRTLVAGACSEPFILTRVDDLEQPVAGEAPVEVGLDVDVPRTPRLYADASCATPLPRLTLPAGTRTLTFHVREEWAGEMRLTAHAGGLRTASQSLTVAPGPPARLAFVTAPPAVQAGHCASPVLLEVRDAHGNAAPPTQPLALSLLATPETGFQFHEDVSCTRATSGLTVPAGESRVGVRYLATVAGAVTVRATAGSLVAAEQGVTVRPEGPPTRLVFTTAPQRVVAGSCSGAVDFRTEDALGNASPAPGGTRVSLSVAPASAVSFFADAACTLPVTEVDVPDGSTDGRFYFRGTSAGPVNVTASRTGWTATTQVETLLAGPATALEWDAIPSPRRQDVPFPVTVRARDAHGNLATSFTGTATLGIAPSGLVTCTTSCTDASTTGAFTNGVWTGSVTVSLVGTDRTLTATSGPRVGTSNVFDVRPTSTDPPPVAGFTASAGVVTVGQSVSFDASGSSDDDTPANALEVSWDFTGGAPDDLPPWTPWALTKTVSHTYTAPGTYTVRLAVRDAPGGVGYAFRRVLVVPAETSFCVVNTTSKADDGASSCAGPFGSDGKLSLAEAVRLSNATAGKQVITFSGPMSLPSVSSLTFSDSVDLLAPSGVVLTGVKLTVASGTVLMSGLALEGTSTLVTVSAGAALSLLDTKLSGGGLLVQGALDLHRAILLDCQTECVRLDSPTASAVVRFSVLYAQGAKGIVMRTCTGNGVALELQSSLLMGLDTGVSQSCGTVSARHNTFHFNANGVSFQGRGGHVLRDNIFTAHTDTVATCGGATFAARDSHFVFANDSLGCLSGDPGTLFAYPQYVGLFEADLRLQYTSGARDAAQDVGLDVNDAAPGRFFGDAPDRGAFESF